MKVEIKKNPNPFSPSQGIVFEGVIEDYDDLISITKMIRYL